MKKITFLFCVQVLTLFALSTQTQAQCVVEQTAQNANFVTGNNEVGMSFIAPVSTAVESIMYNITTASVSGTATMTLHDGNTVVNPLGSTTYAISASGDVTVVFPTPIAVTAGNTYTFMINQGTSQADLGVQTANPYPDGELLRNNGGVFGFATNPDADMRFEVRFQDSIDPTVITQNITVQLDASGQATVLPSAVNNGSLDNCGIATIAFGEVGTAFAEVIEGQNLTITAPVGSLITSVDFASYGTPTGSNGMYTIGACHAANSVAIVEGVALGNNSFTISASNGTFGDPCFGTGKRLYVTVGYSTSFSSDITFTCADVGPNDVNLVVVDESGNSASAPATITVEDNVPPVASCVAPFTLALDANGEASVTPEMIDNGSTDNCGNVTLSFGFVQNGFNGDFAPANWSFNANGGTGSFSFDPSNENVTITGSDGQTGNNINTTLCNTVPFDGSIQFNWNYTTSDGDGPSFDPFGYSLNGTFIALTDPAGATTQNGTANIVVAAGDQFCFVANTTDDSLGSATTVSGMFVFDGTSQSAFTCADLGVNTVMISVTDDSGNTSTCSTDVTIVDSINPVVTCVEFTETFAGCPDGLGPNTPNGVWTPVGPSGGINTAVGGSFVFFLDLTTCVSDNCNSLANLEYTLVDSYEENRVPGCSVDLINEIAIRDVSGNVATTNVIFRGTIESGVTPPTITCPADITVNNDLGVCGAAVTYATPVGTDTCGATTTVQTAGFVSGATFPVGTTTNTFVATDGCGNTATCSFDVTVIDAEAPIIVCPADITVSNDAGVCDYTHSGIAWDATATDNCTVDSITYELTGATTGAGTTLDGVTFNLGDTTVTWTATDTSSNTAVCSFIVTVEDNEAPIITCVPNSIRDTDPGVCEYTVQGTEFDATFTDNCTSATISNNYNGTATIAGEVLPLGDTTVIWTVDDGNGQTDTCTIVITVEDNEAPLMNCPADFTVGTDTGVCGATVSFAEPIALDNCGVASVVQTAGLPSGSVFPVGDSLVEYTATDVNGNTTICNFTITVVDDEAPMAVCMDITIQLDAAGNASIVPADVNGGSTDNCAVDSLSIDIDTFTCADVGPNNVVLTVTDAAGNTSSCIAIVTVEDITPPIAVCQNITVFLDATGTVTIDPSLLDGGSTDACGTANFTYTATPDTFTCAEVGDNTVTLTVTDENGNSATCEATVTVIDNIAPALVCQDITVELDENGMVSILPGDVIASLDDACGIDATGLDIDDFSCDDIGTPVLVNVFANDLNGNIVTCTATVTVVDALAPTVTCPEDQTVTVDNGTQYELPDYFADGLATATDNCTDPVTLFSQTPTAGSLLAPGVYTISLSAEDAFGNIGTCEFELTVDELLGVNNSTFNLSSLKMYPNPATNFVLLSNPQNIPLKDVSIYDVTGRLIKTMDASQVTSEMRLDISELASANYMILINTENGQVTKQLVKE